MHAAFVCVFLGDDDAALVYNLGARSSHLCCASMSRIKPHAVCETSIASLTFDVVYRCLRV